MTKTKISPLKAAPSGILNYELFTNPQPVQVSSSQERQNVIIDNSVTASKTIYCNKIIIGIPKGTDPVSLTDIQPNATINTTKWTLATTEVKKGTDIGLVSSQSYWVFTFQTVSPADNKIDYELIFRISATVNEQVGSFDYELFEFSSTSSNPASFTKKKSSFPMAKAEQQFYLKNFVATTPAAPTVPVTLFANGDAIRFSWESSGNYFTVYEKGSPTPIYAGTTPHFLLKGGSNVDSTFFLVASASGEAGGGFEPIQLYDALTVTISNPDLTPKSVVSSGNITTAGALISRGNATIGGALDVKANSTQTNGSFSGTLGVAGVTSLKNTNINGSLNVTGASSLVNLALSGTLSTTGQVGMFGSAMSIKPGSHAAATTDGFVIGVINSPGATKGISMGWIYGQSGGVTMGAYGGNVLAYVKQHGSKTTYNVASHPGSFQLPVKKGNPLTISANISAGNDANPTYSFYWVPIGSDTAKSINRLGDADDIGASFGLSTAQISSLDIDDGEQQNIDDLMELMQELFGENLNVEKKIKLRAIIKRLVFQEVHKNR